MDSHERVMASINREKPDRIPCDLWAEPGVWERLRTDLRLPTDEAVRERLEVDVRYLSPLYPKTPSPTA